MVFTAGIGENDIATRAEVIAGLGWAGLKLDEAANRTGGPRISTGPGPGAWVVPTNEELVIARQMQGVLAAAKPRVGILNGRRTNGDEAGDISQRPRTRR